MVCRPGFTSKTFAQTKVPIQPTQLCRKAMGSCSLDSLVKSLLALKAPKAHYFARCCATHDSKTCSFDNNCQDVTCYAYIVCTLKLSNCMCARICCTLHSYVFVTFVLRIDLDPRHGFDLFLEQFARSFPGRQG